MRRSFRLCAFRRFTPLLVGLLCAATATPASAQVTDDELQRHVATLLSMARSGFAEVRGARIKSQPSSRDSIVEFKSRYAIGNDNSVVLRRGSAQKNIWYTQHHTRDVDLISDLRLRRPDMRMLEVADSAIAPVIPKGWIRNVRHMQRDIEWKECSGRRGHWVGIYSSSAFSFGLKVGVWDKPCPRGTTQARGAGLSAAQRQYGSIHRQRRKGV